MTTTKHKITSEVMIEKDACSETNEEGSNSAVSKFFFVLPDYMRRNHSHSSSNKNGQSSTTTSLAVDEDGDLVLDRKPATEAAISIEHSIATELKLVGLQIWRGALLLADYVLSHPELFRDRHVLELGSGVGLDGIVASSLAREVCCTDIDCGTGILELIERNFKRNSELVKAKVSVCELDFLNADWCPKLRSKLDKIDVIMAADVIYDDEITAGFVATLARLLDETPARAAYVALEKRYVFTLADLDSVAPMYEEFRRCVRRQKRDWLVTELSLDFPQYFAYQRLKQLVLLKIEKKTR
ncbi:methyltransferase-like protein 22 [Trichogramma pretiosum]|uniref:methyltransferase-like protein 22 n=1 Tax=Trichogramma pretiosum TaxID=7493 RepID=UPI0006C93C75|nr:methyltransferase-like protein 22 [Trichogramma pretiosum]XP_014225900.1 methyltransferase-like protein 22 [Trichogramma pretiosum]XP_014225901.1 methyltransferase-like protein 22 [Trichogramma pretiosum]